MAGGKLDFVSFIKGRMNKSIDERLLPEGEYVDAMNVRLGSTETTEIGAVENSRGNTQLTTLEFGNQSLSSSAKCIGALEDGANETIYWFVHDSNNQVAPGGKVDLIVSQSRSKKSKFSILFTPVIKYSGSKFKVEGLAALPAAVITWYLS